eukprot:Tbor_TRINITY_DN1280_c0_g1::TRINITY_DN1280_c0_g1_i1::g.5774::m.5774
MRRRLALPRAATTATWAAQSAPTTPSIAQSFSKEEHIQLCHSSSSGSSILALPITTSIDHATRFISSPLSHTRTLLAPKGNKGNDAWGDEASEEDLDAFYNPEKSADDFFGKDLGDDGWGGSSDNSKTKKRVKVVPDSDINTRTGVRAPKPSEPHPLSTPYDSAFAPTSSEIGNPKVDTTASHLKSNLRAVDPMLAKESEGLHNTSEEGGVEYIEEEVEVVEVAEGVINPYYASLPLEELLEACTAYLRSADNAKLIDADEEANIFPALLSRIDECSIEQLLDVVQCTWRRSTMDRYGTVFKDLVRDKVLQDAEDLSPEQIHKAIIVLGISAGRRKRDLDLFKVLGKLFVTHINHYKDPNDLVRVMTAFNRAKIVPPNSFLSLMGRRFPVLNKKVSLRALPAYRVFSNMYRMGHDQMNPFRFLADRMYETVMANLKKEKVRLKKMERAMKTGDKSKIEEAKLEIDTEKAMDIQRLAKDTKEPEVYDASNAVAEEEEKWGGAESSANAVRRRFIELTEVRPLHFTKLLLVLSRFGAPHQQYLRPMIDPLLIPSIPYFPPPSLSRIIRCIRMFKSTDVRLCEAIIDHQVDTQGEKAVVSDILEMLRIIGLPDTPVPKNTEKFMNLCFKIFSNESRLRARDMCIVASDLNLFAKKEDVTIPALDTMMKLIDIFSNRMVFLMDIGVLSLTHAEIMEDICRQLKHESAALDGLKEKRREINREGDEDYYIKIDIDVRETFFKIQFIDNFNTYGPWRPVPGLLQVDFKQALTSIRVDFIMEAVVLYEKAYPNQLRITVRRLLSKVILMKLGKEGEEVIVEGEIIMRDNPVFHFTTEMVTKFAEMLKNTPLKRVKRSPISWVFLKEKAEIVGDAKVVDLCDKALLYIKESKSAGATQSSLEKETSSPNEGEEITELPEPAELRATLATA